MEPENGPLEKEVPIGNNHFQVLYMDVSENSGTPKSSILMGFYIINHPFWVPLFLETSI